MHITRNALETMTGPSEWFTGDVYVDTVAAPAGPPRLGTALVHFTPGARTAWHTHPLGQTIYVTEGVGRCRRRGGPIAEIRPGDRVFFEPGEEHWHGAASDRFMSHVTMQEADDTGNASRLRASGIDPERRLDAGRRAAHEERRGKAGARSSWYRRCVGQRAAASRGRVARLQAHHHCTTIEEPRP